MMIKYLSTQIKDYLKPYTRVGNTTENNYLKQIFKGLIKGKLSTLTEIGRENNKQVAQFVKNLSKFLKRWKILKYEIPYFRRIEQKINGNYVILHDETDINKENAKKMEGLTKVRDGSKGENVSGYKINGSIGLSREGNYKIVPIFLDIIDYLGKSFKSEGESLLDSIKKMLSYGIGHSNIHIFDRGYDARGFYEKLFGLGLKFIVRAKMNRTVIFRGEECSIVLARDTLLQELKKKKKRQIEGFELEESKIMYEDIYDSQLNEEPYKITMVVIERPEYKTPMVLYTNCKISEEFYSALNVYQDYLRRWKIESYFKFIKQKFGLEKIQLLGFDVLQKFMFLINLLSTFVFDEYQKKNDNEVLGYFEDVKEFFEKDNVVDSPFGMVDYLGYKIAEQEKTSLQIYVKQTKKADTKQLSLVGFKERLE